MAAAVLTYRPSAPLHPQTKAQIMADATRLAREQSWWSEAIAFYESPTRGFVGRTKLLLGDYETSDGDRVEVAESDDLLMAWHGCGVIAGCLAAWSKRFDIGWHLSLEGGDFGDIDAAGLFSKRLESSLAGLLRAAGVRDAGEALQRRIRETDARYASRSA